MMLAKLSVLSAAVILAGGIGLASAAESGMKGSSMAAQGKCFDQASNSIKTATNPPAKSASGAKQPGQVVTGSSSTTTGSAAKGQRPAAAAGLPDC